MASDRDRQVARLRVAGLGYTEIAATLGIAVSTAREAHARALAAEPRESLEEARAVAAARVDDWLRYLVQVRETFVPLVNQGKIITNPRTGEMFPDMAPGLAAARTAVTALERLARLRGEDAPRVTVQVSDEWLAAEIRRLERELGVRPGQGGTPPPPAPRLALDPPRDADAPPGFR
jgi:hypothetical protein